MTRRARLVPLWSNSRRERRETEPPPAGPMPIGEARVRQRVDFLGTVARTAPVEHPGGPWLEAVLGDGTGEVTLVWPGRTGVPGIGAGRLLRVKGRLAPDRGRRVVFNPDYALLATPRREPN